MVSHSVADKISQVVFAALSLLHDSCESLFPQISKTVRAELNAYVDKAMLWMLDRLGDNNIRIRIGVEKALVSMIENPAIGVYTLVEKLTMGEVKATSANSHRHILGRNSVLYEIVKRFKISTDEVPLEPVMG